MINSLGNLIVQYRGVHGKSNIKCFVKGDLTGVMKLDVQRAPALSVIYSSISRVCGNQDQFKLTQLIQQILRLVLGGGTLTETSTAF